MSLIHLSTELRQELKLTPQLLQSMELLQMNSQELLDYLNQVSEENPLVEQTEEGHCPPPKSGEVFRCTLRRTAAPPGAPPRRRRPGGCCG